MHCLPITKAKSNMNCTIRFGINYLKFITFKFSLQVHDLNHNCRSVIFRVVKLQPRMYSMGLEFVSRRYINVNMII